MELESEIAWIGRYVDRNCEVYAGYVGLGVDISARAQISCLER